MATIKGDYVIGYGEYWREIKALAKQAKKEVRGGGDTGDVVNALLDSHQWIIYTAYNPFVLIHSPNKDAYFESMGGGEFDSYSDAMGTMAYRAMGQDVHDELNG